jgi:Ca2+-binding RTX toxin-like protein
MAFLVVSTNQSTSVFPASGDFVLVQQNAAVTSAGDGIGGFSAGNLNVRIDGIVAGEDNGAELGTNSLITVGATGSLLGKSCGLWLNGTGSVAYNAGTIQSLGDGVSFIEAAIALNSTANALIDNTGSVIGRGIGIDLRNSTGTVISNAGRISASAEAITGTAGLTVRNGGTILSTGAEAIDLSTATDSLKLRNEGVLTAPVTAVAGGAGADRLVNQGVIDGAIALGAEADTVHNRGQIFGNVDLGTNNDKLSNLFGGVIDGTVTLGDGNDTYDGRGGVVLGPVLGGLGTDIFIGNAFEADTFDGGAESDTLNFRYGPAVIVALDGSFDNDGAALGDSYSGIENVIGSAKADQITGNNSGNTLQGLGGADTINGSAGNDFLRGGNGVDNLTGGTGDDRFVFGNLNERGDTITDFQNLAGNNDRFEIGASAFGGGLTAGTFLSASQFQSRADNAAQDGDDRFIFRTTDNTLWFDADGNLAGAAVMIADLQTGASISEADILLT